MRVPRLLPVVLLILPIGGSLWLDPTLPGQIPRHFEFTGPADAYWDTTLFRWLLLPLVGLFSAASVYVPIWVVGTVPSSWSMVTSQEEYDALPALPADKQ